MEFYSNYSKVLHARFVMNLFIGCFSLLCLLSVPVARAADSAAKQSLIHDLVKTPASPYPPSPVIASIEWAPTNQIVRAAHDGDNWPVTWADDDAIYTTWGDGTGFIPKVEKKLSCGFARVTGSPERFTGVNIRSTAEQLGQGVAGKKAGDCSVSTRFSISGSAMLTTTAQ